MPDCGALIVAERDLVGEVGQLADRFARLVDDPEADDQHRDRRQRPADAGGELALHQPLVGEPDAAADDQGREPGVGDRAHRGGRPRPEIWLIVSPVGERVEAEGEAEQREDQLQDEEQPQPDPVEDHDEAVGDVADRVRDPGRDEDVEAVVGGRVVALRRAVGFAGRGGSCGRGSAPARRRPGCGSRGR